MSVRAAQPGDLFLLLLPDEADQTIPSWQQNWQARYGGQCTQPLHVSLQRFTCADAAQQRALLTTLQQATQSLPPIPLTGIALQPLRSAFRQQWILKCRIQAVPALHTLADLVCTQLRHQGLIPDFPWYPSLITVLEAIDALPEADIDLSAPQPLFIGNRLLLSQVIGRNRFVPIGQWQLAAST